MPDEAGSSGPTPELRGDAASARDRASETHAPGSAHNSGAGGNGDARERDDRRALQGRHVRRRHSHGAACSCAAVAESERLAHGRQGRSDEGTAQRRRGSALRRRGAARRRSSTRARGAAVDAHGNGSGHCRRQRHRLTPHASEERRKAAVEALRHGLRSVRQVADAKGPRPPTGSLPLLRALDLPTLAAQHARIIVQWRPRQRAALRAPRRVARRPQATARRFCRAAARSARTPQRRAPA